MKEGIIPGWERYKIVIDDTSCRCIIIDSGRVLKNNIPPGGFRVMWRLKKDGKGTMLTADRVIEKTFPGIAPGDYIYQLYQGLSNTRCGSVRRVDISPSVYLEQLYGPTCYCLTTPREPDIKKEIKRMYPGPLIDVEKGDCDALRRELYFTSNEHMLVVKEKIADFLNQNQIF